MMRRPFVLQVHQRGAATLVIVMVLFLVMALLAAYASRSLLFEQRISASYARASLAQEVAEGGIEWTLAQLNAPAIDGACQPNAGGHRFVDKYLPIDAADRSILNLPSNSTGIAADCRRDASGSGWVCQCPDNKAWTAPAAATGPDITPSFGVKFPSASSRSGTINVAVVGCTDSVVTNCAGLYSDERSRTQVALSTQWATFALVSAVRTPPAAPLIVKGDLTMTGTGLGLHNTDPRSAGALLAIGGTWSGMNDARMQTVPGSALDQVRFQNDTSLKDAPSADDVFKMFMGMRGAQYRQHPALREVVCSGDCGAALAEAYAAGKRILWVDGPMQLLTNQVIGTLNDPVLIIANRVVLNGPFQINGMVVAQGDLDWTNTGSAASQVAGMVLVTGNMTTAGTMDIAYQQAVADQLRNRIGSFVRVPGSWRDGD